MYSDAGITCVDRAVIADLKALAAGNERKRVRLCAHCAPSERLHEMLIVHARGTYVRPHKHPGKTESTHVIEGEVDVVVLDDAGEVTQVMELGDYGSGKIFYYRMASAAFHTLIIRSPVLVFHETTDGPFDRNDTVFAEWAPAGDDDEATRQYIAALDDRIKTKSTTNRV